MRELNLEEIYALLEKEQEKQGGSSSPGLNSLVNFFHDELKQAREGLNPGLSPRDKVSLDYWGDEVYMRLKEHIPDDD